jgi:DNA modification methylase
MTAKRRPGEVRDAIVAVLSAAPEGAPLAAIERGVASLLGKTPRSSIRSYLGLNTPSLFIREARGIYTLRGNGSEVPTEGSSQKCNAFPQLVFSKAKIYQADCFVWLRSQQPNSIHGVVTDPPYGLFEYTPEQQEKLRNGKGGVWRIPPTFDGAKRSPLPRFTVLADKDLRQLDEFFYKWALLLIPVLVPGANVIVASNPLLSYIVSAALARAGLERRGEIVRLVMTMRGGDRPKAAHTEFSGVSVMPRSMWEPWLLFRKPLEGRVQDNLRKWSTGGFRRPSPEKPFGDVILSAPTRKAERALAPHPSLKPQQFMRVLVRGVLPLGEGIVLDPFCGAGSTLAAAESADYTSIGVEIDPHFFEMCHRTVPALIGYKNGSSSQVSLL